MRVTQRSVTRNYLKNLNRNINSLSNSNDKMSSMRKFNKVSDDTAASAKAFNIREQIYKNEQYLRNISDVSAEFSTAESNILNMSKILQNVEDRVLQGKTGTVPEDARLIISSEISKLKEQILTNLNGQFTTKYIFGGSSNEVPFGVDNAGFLTYNGVEVRSIVLHPTTGKPSVSNGAVPPVFTEVPMNKDVYVDLGLGLRFDDTGNVDRNSALKISISGLDISGFGTKSIGGEDVSINIYDLLTTVENAFKDNDMSNIDELYNQIKEIKENISVSITEIGSRSTFIEQTAQRIENEVFNLKVAQNDLESLDVAKETIYNKTFEMAWQVSLQLGSKIIPASIFDFMR